MARAHRGAEELRERGEPDPRDAPCEQPAREPDGVHHGRSQAAAGDQLDLAVEEGQVEAGVVGDEDGVLAGEGEEAADRRRRARRPAQVAVMDPRQARDHGRELDARVDERLERACREQCLDADGADLADPGAGRPQARRLEVDDDEARRLEGQPLAGRRGQADAVTTPGEADVAFDDVLEQAPGERHGRMREREERAGRLLGGNRPPALLNQLDEPVGRIERQLHPSEHTRTYVRSQSGRMPGDGVEVPRVAATSFEQLAFRGRWRRYQKLALESVENDLAQGRWRSHIVAPPGSGKTLVGVELIRRLGRPALVLVPNTAIQAQWLRAVELFGGDGTVAAPDTSSPISVLTYQSLCQLDDPAGALGDLAGRRWATQRAKAIASTPDEVQADSARWTGEAARRRDREVRKITASLKREIARAEHGDLHLGQLLSAGARERLEALDARGVNTIVLDECHHLASLWGYVVRAGIEELGDVHLIGLTATPPGELTAAEEDLYEALLGPVDFTVPTPAVVREGYLAPYQELAWLTEPLQVEADWLAEHDLRFQELITTLHDDVDGPLSFPSWVLTRLRDRQREGEEAKVTWASFQRRHPALARAGARFLTSAGLPLPPGAPRGEGYREVPSLDDWLVILEDYALKRLSPDPSPEAAAKYEAVAAALRDLGFNLTRQGIRRGASDVDRLLTMSAAKSIALVEVVDCEYVARGEALRALVLTDSEQAAATADEVLLGVLRPEAGTAPEAVLTLGGDARTAPLRPLLVSGRGLRCTPDDADVLLAALQERVDERVKGWTSELDADGLARLQARGGAWTPRLWVALATELLADGVVKALVGTRALLGEGWDAPCVNVLVDLSAATTSVSVTQMRGRSLRLDPDDPEKIASNWDIVCVASGLARGDADYRRFVRKHLHLFAPSEDGVIEAGPSHVHPALSPFAPPAATEFNEINRSMVRRAREHRQARELWAIGEPYLGEEHETLVVRPEQERVLTDHDRPPAYPTDQRIPLGLAGAGAVLSPLAAAGAGEPLALLGIALVPLALAWGWRRMARTRRELQESLPLDLVAYAVRDAYQELGELSETAGASLAIEPRSSGYLRVWLKEASTEESSRFTVALNEVIEPTGAPRYLVSRLVPSLRSSLAALFRAATFREPFERRWVEVPSDLGRRKDRAQTFGRAWRRWLGPTQLVFTQRSEQGKAARAAAGAQSADYRALRRRVWL